MTIVTLPLFSFDCVTSTMDKAEELIREQKVSSNFFVQARNQTQGRGRQGRHWVAEEGKGLLLTAAFLLPQTLQEKSQLSLVAGVALHRALADLLTAPLLLKWPNDLLIQGKKLGGILVELCEENERTWALVGVGINLKGSPVALSASSASLEEYALHPIAEAPLVERTMQMLHQTVETWLSEGFDELRTAWLKCSMKKGKKISFHDERGQKISCVFNGIDDRGFLKVLTGEGAARTYASGDIFFLTSDRESAATSKCMN